MKGRYVDRNVNLSLLSRWLDRFFTRRSFVTTVQKAPKGLRITAKPTQDHEIVDSVTIHVSGDPSNFELIFSTGGRSGVFMKLGQLTALFGGGLAFLRGIKSQEAEEKLEKSFWIYAEEKIDLLSGSQIRS